MLIRGSPPPKQDRWVLNGHFFPNNPLLLGYETRDYLVQDGLQIRIEPGATILLIFGAHTETNLVLFIKWS